MNSALKFILSFFAIGNLPKMPGTFGSLAAIPFFFLLNNDTIKQNLGTFFVYFFIICIAFSFIIDYYQRKNNVIDPSWIVIDEVLGMIFAWSFIQSTHWFDILGIFIFFRIFDIFKIWPSTYFNKEVKHGAGVIFDDLFAALYAGFFFNLLKNIFF